MSEYSFIQRQLHRIVLSTRYMREVTFDAEKSSTKTVKTADNHVFIAGLARSGTTTLLNALYASHQFASLSYRDMPFVLAPNLWSKLSPCRNNLNFVERAHGDGIEISTESPEAFEEVFWMTFSEDIDDTRDKFKNYVQLVNHRYKKDRYLSKNNQNIKRLRLISEIFPCSKILILFRSPIQQANSLLLQHKRFIEKARGDEFISNYMNLIGHTEFGPNYVPIINNDLHFRDDLTINHWLEQWYLSYKNCREFFKKSDSHIFVCYEDLCSKSQRWSDLLQTLNINQEYDFDFIESTKIVSFDMDEDLTNRALGLYTELYNVAAPEKFDTSV